MDRHHHTWCTRQGRGIQTLVAVAPSVDVVAPLFDAGAPPSDAVPPLSDAMQPAVRQSRQLVVQLVAMHAPCTDHTRAAGIESICQFEPG